MLRNKMNSVVIEHEKLTKFCRDVSQFVHNNDDNIFYGIKFEIRISIKHPRIVFNCIRAARAFVANGVFYHGGSYILQREIIEKLFYGNSII